MTFSVAPNLDGLANLARRPGVDIRPILVRVLTDLYVAKAEHSAEEEQHYIEIMLRFVDTADVPMRANISRKLADYPAAPRAVLNKLARDRIEIAEPLLRHANKLNAADLTMIAAECGGAHAAIVAARQAASRTREAAIAVPISPAAPIGDEVRADPSRISRLAAAKPIVVEQARPAPSLEDIARRFLVAESGERRRMLSELGRSDAAPHAIARIAAETMQGLERYALQRRLADFTSAVQQTLSLSPSLAQRVIDDESGELLVVCLRAMAMPPNVLLRVLLFLNPVIGQSVDQVYELGRLYETISESAAAQVVTGLQQLSRTDVSAAPEQARAKPDIAQSRHTATDGARAMSGDGLRSPVRSDHDVARERRYATT